MPYRLPLRRTLGLALAALSMAVALAPVSAETPRRVRSACAVDAQRFCPREKPNSPEMEYCMEAKGRQLSRQCIRALEDAGMIPRGHFSKN